MSKAKCLSGDGLTDLTACIRNHSPGQAGYFLGRRRGPPEFVPEAERIATFDNDDRHGATNARMVRKIFPSR